MTFEMKFEYYKLLFKMPHDMSKSCHNFEEKR